ncbi:DUF3291 domain-containing protein [Maribacter sp. 4G9]|uniref:DUF3291 domain-containing protein n=1 Tax=Maribacter sp. 4G9 TaxID=1889777 RepID=UPI000C1627A5|nr:DUF3291 domain-containing protein [Maribacter sp. 4G9]PIB38913.1 DUF3291 domain-containing protein [Maribacter sp. 4G9]
MSQVTTLTFFRYLNLKGRIWAFGTMQFAHSPLSKVSGLQMYKLMGSGKQGFNPLPDWSVYALLQIWENEASADAFFDSSPLMKSYLKKSNERWTVYMKNSMAKGKWSGKNPFLKSNSLEAANPFIAVITRATIKPRMLFRFWKYVPTSQKPLRKNTGLLFTKGIGEVPVLQMATFSIWRDKESLMNFAYSSKEHQKAIQKTRQLNWYKEELFSRFQPYRSIGAWMGKNPLPDLNYE